MVTLCNIYVTFVKKKVLFVLEASLKKKENICSKIHTNTFFIFDLAQMKKIKFFNFSIFLTSVLCNFCLNLHFRLFHFSKECFKKRVKKYMTEKNRQKIGQ